MLLGEPTRDLHVKHFGWARFRACDIDFMLSGTGKRYSQTHDSKPKHPEPHLPEP